MNAARRIDGRPGSFSLSALADAVGPVGDYVYRENPSMTLRAARLPFDVVLMTARRGEVGVPAGDSLVQRPSGEAWPVERTVFEAADEPLGEGGSGGPATP